MNHRNRVQHSASPAPKGSATVATDVSRDACAITPSQRAFARNAGFSIIELALSLGILGFAFIGLLGLLPVGMNTFRQSIDASVSLQISQRIVGEALDSDFNTFINKTPEVRYFDDQANELPDAKDAIYHVNVRVQPAVTVPGATDANSHLAGITVQIARNPRGKILTCDSNGLWQADCAIPMTWYSTFLAGACNQTPL